MRVPDNPQLLNLMLCDMSAASAFYRPTKFWADYEKVLLPELKNLGLTNYRRRKDSVMEAIGATDLTPISAFLHNPPVWGHLSLRKRMIRFLYPLLRRRAVGDILDSMSKMHLGFNLREVRLMCYELAKEYGQRCGATPIEHLNASDAGNPEDTFLIDGRMYTTSILNYYLQYAYCCQFLDFNEVKSIVELGSGSGKQIEVIKKLHPQITFFAFDIAPQLYICEQYLATIFPESVISYKVTREKDFQAVGKSGKILILGAWRFEDFPQAEYDLFWNSASLQEMEPNIIRNYLQTVRGAARNAFLHEDFTGISYKSSPEVKNVYLDALSNFELLDMTKAIHLPEIGIDWSFSFWKRR